MKLYKTRNLAKTRLNFKDFQEAQELCINRNPASERVSYPFYTRAEKSTRDIGPNTPFSKDTRKTKMLRANHLPQEPNKRTLYK
jgi:hypothetical protein